MLKALTDLQHSRKVHADAIESITIEASPRADSKEPVSGEFLASLAAAILASTASSRKGSTPVP